MKNCIILLTLLSCSFVIWAKDLTADELINAGDFESQLLSMEVQNEFERREYSPIKKFYFYQGDVLLTERDFEELVQDPAIQENKRKLKEVTNVGFGSTFALAGLATAFLIPSVVFVVTQTNYSHFSSISDNYQNWGEYYKKNYDFTILPGLINIGLTFVFSVATVINLAVTFSMINKYKYNELLYREIIENYNLKLKKRYSVMPNLSLNNFGGEAESIVLGLKITL